MLRVVPESVRSRYLQVGDEYHFLNGKLAFRDKGNRLSTPLENPEVIRDLIAIARERGWRELAVVGPPGFRSEVYQQARLAGLDVPGYAPTEIERQQLAHRMRSVEGRDPGSSADPKATAPEMSRPEKVEQTERNRRELDETQERIYRGRLVDHGAASYRFDPREEKSYFLLIETQRGEEYVWGQDLQRAMESSLSHAGVGQEVVVRERGPEASVVSSPVRDEEGRAAETAQPPRSRWSVETEEFLAERRRLADIVRNPQVSPTDGVSKHPGLAGTYDELYAAKLVAANQNFTKEEVDRFLSRIRESIAQEIERGEPLSPPIQRARYRGDTQSARTHQQVQDRVR